MFPLKYNLTFFNMIYLITFDTLTGDFQHPGR